MSMTLANLKTAVYSRLEADASSPDYTAINEDNITLWANEKTNAVIMQLLESGKPELLAGVEGMEEEISLTYGFGSLPSDYLAPKIVTLGSSKVPCILADSDAYSKWDYVPLSPEEEKKNDFLQLSELGTAVTLTGGSGDLPSDFYRLLTVKVGSSQLPCMIVDSEQFSKWDYVPTDPETETLHDNILQLTVYDESITLTSGSGSLPSDFAKLLGVKAGSNKIKCRILTPEEFSRWNANTNFIFDPQTANPVAMVIDEDLKVKPVSYTAAYIDYIKKMPVALALESYLSVKPTTTSIAYIDYIKKIAIANIAEGYIRVKPTTYTEAYLNYYREHPTLAADQDTLFSSVGDSLLIELVVAEAKTFLNTMD